MAVTPKPANKPAWATAIVVDGGGRTNAIQPPVGREPEGWIYIEKPPRNYMNWMHYTNYNYVNYFEAMTDANDKAATLVIAAEDASDQWKQTADYKVSPGADAALQINSAITALPAHGGSIVLSDGTFTVRTPITTTFGDRVKISGQGPYCTTIEIQDGYSIDAFQIADVEFCVLEDFRIYGSPTGGEIQNGIVAGTTGSPCSVHCNRIWVDRVLGGPTVAVGTPKGVAFYASGTNVRLTITDCRRDMYGDAVTPLYSGEDVIGHNGAHVKINGFVVKNLNAYAASTAKSIWMSGCTFDIDGVSVEDLATADGIRIDGCDDSRIGRMYVEDCTTDGMVMSGTNNRFQCEDFVVKSAGSNGARIDGIVDGAVKITSHTSGSHGIFGRNLTRCRIVPIVNAAGGNGVDLAAATVVRCQIVGGSVKNSTADGITVAGTGNIINGTEVTVAVNCVVVSGFLNKVNGCHLHDASVDGLSILVSAQFCTHSGNVIWDSANNNITLAGQNCKVSGNECLDAADAAISITGAANDNMIDGNDVQTFAVVPAYGIEHMVNSPRGNYIQNNRCDGIASTADLRIIGAYANTPSNPQTIGLAAWAGVAGHAGPDVRDNNQIQVAALV